MESDLPLIEMAGEDDSLLQQFSDLDQTPSESTFNFATFSPLALPPSHAKNLKYGVRMEKSSSSSSKAINNKENLNSNRVEVPNLGMEPMQMKKRKKGGGYNLRKSLAWDRAFFTDEGILNPLELTLITGIDAKTCGGGLPTISEERNSSFSSDSSCTDECGDMEASEEGQNKALRDKNRTPRGSKEKSDCSTRNGSVLHQNVTHKVLSSDCANRGGLKVAGCLEPLASSLKRPANSNILKSAKIESKLPKLPISKPGSCVYATPKDSMVANQLRHILISKPTKNVEKHFGLKSSLQNVHGSQSKAKIGPGNIRMPVRELAQKTVKNLTHSSKAASSTRAQLVHVGRANSGPEMVSDTLQSCKVQKEPAPLAAKHLTQPTAANSNNSLPEAARLSSSGPSLIQRASKGLMISDRLHSCESQQGPAALARPSGLRLPSPSLRLFDMGTASDSGSLQQKKIQHYMGSDRKYGEPWLPARPPMKSNDIAENIGCVGLTFSKEYGCASTTQLSPSPNYMLNTGTKRAPVPNIYQNLVTKVVPRVGIKLEYECGGSEQEKQILRQEETAATWKGDEGIKASHPTEQLAGNVGTCRQLMSEGRVPQTNYKSVLHNKDGLQSYTTFSKSKFGESVQHQEENISTGVDDRAQTSWECADAEKSEDASSKVNPESHLNVCSQVFVESQEQDGIKKREDDVGTTNCLAPGIESCSVVLQHGQENDVSKVVDDKSLLMQEDEADVIELKGIDTSCIPCQNLNTEQRNDDADGLVVFPTATSPRVRDPSAEVGNGIHVNPTTSISSKAQLRDSLGRDTVTHLNDNVSAEGFNLEPTTIIESEHQLSVTLLLHDNPSSTKGFHFIPTNYINNKAQLQDTGTANGSPKCFEATTCISALQNSQLSEEGTFHNVTDISDHLFQEKSVSSAILVEVPGENQDGFDVELIPREVAPLIDDHNQSSGLSHFRPQVEFISEIESVGEDALIKRKSVLQGAQCTSTYRRSLEKERLDIVVPTVDAQHKIPAENHKSQEVGIFVAAEKSQDSCGDIPEAKPTVQGCTGGPETHSQFQNEHLAFEGSGPINNISETNVQDVQEQLLDGDVLVQSSSRLMSEVHNHSIENADHSDIHGKQPGFSNTTIKVERVSKSNHEHSQQESICKAVWHVVEGSDVYEGDPTLPNTIIVDAAPSVVEEIGNHGGKLCVDYRTSGSVVIDSIAEHNENYTDGQSAECIDLTCTLDSELELSVEDKTPVESSTCMEYCSAREESCSFPTDSLLEEKATMFLEDRVQMKGSLLSTENILGGVIVAEENSDAGAQILPVVQVNGDYQPQSFVGITPSVEINDYFTNGRSQASFSVSQETTTGVETTSTPELCCLVGDESLLTKSTNMIEAEGSKLIMGEQVDATQMVGEFQHEMDDAKDHKDVTVLAKKSNSIKMEDSSLFIHPPNAVPFSDEWLAAFEAAGEEILTMKCGAVQHSPPDKSLPEPSPWSPVKKKTNQIGPYDCTKYTNAMP